MNDIKSVFDLLNRWAPFPKYQLERRADIFFAFYLPEIMKMEKFGETISHDDIIPEFPIKKDDSNLSNNVDYVVIGEKAIYFIELKTAMDSFDPADDYDNYLKKALSTMNFSVLLEEIAAIRNASNEKAKYDELIKHLCCIERIKDKIEVRIKDKIEVKMDDKKPISIKCESFDIPIKPVYILPFIPGEKHYDRYKNKIDYLKNKIENDKCEIIAFEEIRTQLSNIKEQSDQVKRLSESLEIWLRIEDDKCSKK